MISVTDDRLLALARTALSKGDVRQCLGFIGLIPEPRRPRGMAGEVAYHLAKNAVATGHYDDARTLFARAASDHPMAAIRSLSQERNHLLHNILDGKQESAAANVHLLAQVHLKPTKKLFSDMLQPIIETVTCLAPYRSGYDPKKGDPLSVLIRRIKHGVEEDVVRRLGRLMAIFAHASDILNDVDFAIPVPTDPERETDRGYSIPRLLAEEISAMCALPLHEEFVHSSGEGTKLSQVPRWFRSEAAQEAYVAGEKTERLVGLCALVVDDVMTTGATLQRVGTILRDNGAIRVHAIALAHTEWSG